MSHILIPKEIERDEPLIRCVIPSKMHNGRFKDDAMLPRLSNNDVSLLREKYTTLGFCVEHGKSIDTQTHQLGALLRLSQRDVDEVNAWAQTEASIVEDLATKTKAVCGMKAHVEYSPMDDGHYVSKTDDFYMDSPISLPMHADMLFEEPLEKGFVRTRMRKFANELIKRCQKALMNRETDDLGDWIDGNKVP